MSRKYTHIKQYENEIFQLKEKGYSHREIGEKLGFTKEEVKDFFHRQNHNARRLEEGHIPQKKGRPRVRPLTAEEELKKEIERLQMENELLRDFLSETGRK